jgi:hypothetical protein
VAGPDKSRNRKVARSTDIPPVPKASVIDCGGTALLPFLMAPALWLTETEDTPARFFLPGSELKEPI